MQLNYHSSTYKYNHCLPMSSTGSTYKIKAKLPVNFMKSKRK